MKISNSSVFCRPPRPHVLHFGGFRMKKELPVGFNSRQYMKDKAFEIFFYNDFNLNHVAAHAHPYYEIYFFLNGNVVYEVEGSRYQLRYGDYLLIPPQTRHHPVFLNSGQDYRRFVLWLSKPFYQELVSQTEDFAYGFRQAAEKKRYHFQTGSIISNEIQSRLLDILEESRGKRPFHETAARLAICSFLLFLNRITYDILNQIPYGYENVLYLNICDYINNHLDEDLSLQRLSSFFFTGKYHISHVFKDNMGLSLHQYILKKRLRASKNGILSGIPLGELYQQYGFTDYSGFYRAFKKEFSLSPREFRDLNS